VLYERQWDRKRIVELLRAIDWFLELPKGLRQKLQTEIYRIEERQTMKYVTSFERDAKEEGIVIGKELGVVEGIEKGKELGVEIGLEKGVLQGRLEVARNLMASGFSAEQAASIAEVPVELLQSS
jgi:predicted transposase/invertase (TIGR01784 family)